MVCLNIVHEYTRDRPVNLDLSPHGLSKLNQMIRINSNKSDLNQFASMSAYKPKISLTELSACRSNAIPGVMGS